MNISVIIPTRNRVATLGVTLNSLMVLVQGHADVEVLVVDNGSTDSTAVLVANFQERFSAERLQYFLEPIPGLLSGRHRGAVESSGDILAFLDDDVILSPDWFTGLRTSFQDSSVGLVGGPSFPCFEGPTPDWLDSFWKTSDDGRRWLGELSLLEVPTEHPFEIEPEMVWGLNFAIRRDAFVKAGGFHPDCVPAELQHFQGDGETGLSQKLRLLGLKAVYHPAVAVEHQIGRDRLCIEYFEARHFYQGVCDSFTALRSSGCRFVDEQHGHHVEQSRGAIGRIRAFFRRPFRRPPNSPLREESEAASPHERCRQARQRGFRFHQECARRSCTLRQWIMKPDYFDYNYPTLEPEFVVPQRQVHAPSQGQQ